MDLNTGNIAKAQHGDKFRVTGEGKVSHEIKIQENVFYNTVWYCGQAFTPDAYMDLYGKFMGSNAKMELIK